MQAAGAEPVLPDDAVEVGRIVGAWGIRGGIKVQPHAADPQALFSSKRWYLQPPATASAPAPRVAAKAAKAAGVATIPPLLRIVQAREQGDAVVATAQELPDRNAAEAVKGARVFISRASFPTADDDEFYWVDLIGLAVVDRQSQPLGTVVGLVETGPHCVLRVQPEDAAADERLIPFVAAYVDRVDLAARRILVDWSADYDL